MKKGNAITTEYVEPEKNKNLKVRQRAGGPVALEIDRKTGFVDVKKGLVIDGVDVENRLKKIEDNIALRNETEIDGSPVIVAKKGFGVIHGYKYFWKKQSREVTVYLYFEISNLKKYEDVSSIFHGTFCIPEPPRSDMKNFSLVDISSVLEDESFVAKASWAGPLDKTQWHMSYIFPFIENSSKKIHCSIKATYIGD